MQVLEAPPKIDEPTIPGDDGNARFVMIIDSDVRTGPFGHADLHSSLPPEKHEDYVGHNAAQSMRRVWARRGLTLLGCQISHIACNCGNNCTGSIWGLVIPRRDKELFTLIRHAMSAGALSLEQVDDLSIQVGVFTVEARDGTIS